MQIYFMKSTKTYYIIEKKTTDSMFTFKTPFSVDVNILKIFYGLFCHTHIPFHISGTNTRGRI